MLLQSKALTAVGSKLGVGWARAAIPSASLTLPPCLSVPCAQLLMEVDGPHSPPNSVSSVGARRPSLSMPPVTCTQSICASRAMHTPADGGRRAALAAQQLVVSARRLWCLRRRLQVLEQASQRVLLWAERSHTSHIAEKRILQMAANYGQNIGFCRSWNRPANASSCGRTE
jgi:hypothetical protein